ncbi:MAG: DUF1732 domain-containing protein [Leptospiraceae bacterium]|nr:DUF1732 domain-containing protein [Leptospiraceae bacterium]
MQSMTGYGESSFTIDGAAISYRIRSFNAKGLEVNYTSPAELGWFEIKALETIQSRFGRGKIDIQIELTGQMPVEIKFNEDILKNYELLLSRYYGKKKVQIPVESIVHLPGLFQSSSRPLKDHASRIEFYFLRALLKMERTRIMEGKKIISFMKKRVRNLERLKRRITGRQNQWLTAKRGQIRRRFLDFNEPAEKAGNPKAVIKAAHRFWNEHREELIEVLRVDISEEIERVEMHCERINELLTGKVPAGKQLDIYLQELQRETNTMCMKAQEASMNQLAVLMKLEVERLREQVRNLE